MRKTVLPVILLIAASLPLQAQTLFTFGNDKVSKEEFLRVYQKNALNKKPDMTEPALREYLNLYSLFKMKVKEAEASKIDTIESLHTELTNYRKQVAKNYLTDNVITDKLVKEAYDRKKEEVSVAHILLTVPRGGTPADTMAVKNRIDSIYTALTKGKANWNDLVKNYTDDKGTIPTNGGLGYITALQTVYPFETVAYQTKKGSISTPVRTQFGYHIIKVLDRRANPGEIEVAQILITAPESKGAEGAALAQRKMDTVLANLKNGASFESQVKKYSDDRYSNNLDGVIPAFGTGRMVPAFEKAAFDLKKPGDISSIVKTEFGLHLIKLLRKIPISTYDSSYSDLKRKVEADPRAVVARETYMNNIKTANKYTESKQALEEIILRIEALPDTGKMMGRFVAEDFARMNQPLFTIGGKSFLQNDFTQYMFTMTRGSIMGPRRAVVNDLFKMYQDNVINDFQEQQLSTTHPEFKQLMQDYRDGIMLFELMDRKVWSAAMKDSVGLQKFYDAHKSKYQWEPGFRGTIYTLKDEAAMKAAMNALLVKNAKAEDVATKVNTSERQDALSARTGYFEFSKYPEIPAARLTAGKVSDAFKNADGTYTVVQTEQIYTTGTQKTLDESRGFVISEYQDQLEKDWNAYLRNKYPVKVDEPVFKTMIGK